MFGFYMGSFKFPSFSKIWFGLGGWVGFLWLSLVENPLKDPDSKIPAMWLWANT